MPLLALVLALLLFVSPQAGRAQQNAVVLELYTSQGCSSCPPADALLPKLADMPGVIALALHVDYWDYLGWKDSFGNVQYTKRQKAYAKALHHRPLYTPQAVIQGQDIIVGHQEPQIVKALNAYMSEPSPVRLDIDRGAGGILSIRATSRDGAALPGPFDVQLVQFLESEGVDIEGGENAGRNMTYTNIVTDWRTVAHWDGLTPLDLEITDLAPDQPVAVIVQEAGTGPVVTAAELH
ncbi:MAG: DUF1223 domain-containing protein [Rhodobacteraceae bacterium]|uniref:DUF1223 domain-containing protein n=1 Tax=Amaricoccus sp. B4 TaxID=3368557 RepID=UPI000DACB94D|nr:DUF1223 domain-containing protein [Paracoccaceae bacterium]